MRLLLAAAVALGILVGTRAFLVSTTTNRVTRIALQEQEADGKFQIQLVPMFDAGPDAFALDTADASTLIVEMRGQTIYNRQQPAANGTPIVIDDVQGLVAGDNELFIRATPASDDPNAIRAIRVRVLRNGRVIAEVWLSSEPGTPAEGTVRLQLTATDVEQNSHEDHG